MIPLNKRTSSDPCVRHCLPTIHCYDPAFSSLPTTAGVSRLSAFTQSYSPEVDHEPIPADHISQLC